MKCHVNLKLLPIKAHFLLSLSAISPLMPFLPVIGRDLGFSGMVVGTVMVVCTSTCMVSKIFLNALADKYQIKKELFICILVLQSFVYTPLNFLPTLPTIDQVRATCKDEKLQFQSTEEIKQPGVFKKIQETNETVKCQVSCPMSDDWIKLGTTSWGKSISRITTTITPKKSSMKDNIIYFPIDQVVVNGVKMESKCTVKELSIDCDVECNSEAVSDSLHVRKEYKLMDAMKYYQFWLYLFIMVVGWLAFGMVWNLGDTLCFEMLDDHPELYGNQRLWGAVGRGVFSIISGFMIEALNKDTEHTNYASVLILMFILVAMDVVVATFFPASKKTKSQSLIKDIRRLLSQIEIVIFMIWCILIGAFLSLLWGPLFWRIEEMAENYPQFRIKRRLLEGLVMGIRGLAGEFPFYYLSGWIIKRLGHLNCITLVLFTYSVRFFIYSFTINPWFILPIECLNGITFALFFATMVSYASIIAPPGAEATTQALVTSMTDGIGITIGNLSAGLIIDRFGTARLFQSFSAIASLCCIVQFSEQKIRVKYRRNQDISNGNAEQ